MARRGDTCLPAPEVNGVPSKMYKDMTGKKNKVPRPVANYIYSRYKASNMADAMDQVVDQQGNQKYKRNSQGEHNADDVLEFINYNAMLSESKEISLVEKRFGAVDQNGVRVDFTNPKDALDIANDINNTPSQGLSAMVVKHGNIYNVIVAERTSRTLDYAPDVRTRLQMWDMYKQAFNSVGVDIENLPDSIKDTFNAYNKDLAVLLHNIQNTDIGYLTKKDLEILFHLDSGSQEVQRLIAAFGSIEDAAQARYDISRGRHNYTIGQQTLLTRAVTHAKRFSGLDIQALRQQAAQMQQQAISASEETSIKQELERLNRDYNIDIDILHRQNMEIKKLSDAATEAVVLLNRKIRELKKQKGRNAEGKVMEQNLIQLSKELANKRYYNGILNFMNTATSDIMELDNMINMIPQQTGNTEYERAAKVAKILMDIKSLRDQYYDIISALANENLTIDESISQTDIDNIRQTAQSLKDLFDRKQRVTDSLGYEAKTMQNLLTSIIGDRAADGQYIANIVSMAQADSSIFDYLYSVGRASNPVIAAMGKIIRDAQKTRDESINDIDLRVRRATDKLYKAGFTSEFMYEDAGHIISDIDWQAYKRARTAAIRGFYAQGMRGFDLKQAIEDWEENNTEDREVDTKNHRMERVPSSYYRKPFPQLEPAQQEYYDTMMQIKGELGTLLPDYAQKQYLPPQLRRTMLDAIAKAKNAGQVFKAIKNKFENLWKIREDDTDFSMNGIIDGDEYHIAEGEFDNTPLRQIPIFFVNPVEKEELLRNFSTGIMHLAGTAINYKAMNDILQTVEFIGNFVTNPKRRAREDTQQAEVIKTGALAVVKDLVKRGRNTNTEDLITGFMQQHFYGKKYKKENMWTKFANNIIGYTSFKGLSSNLPGAIANWLVGEFQMFIEAIGKEFYSLKDFAWAHKKLVGSAGVTGELSELLTNNMNHKATLMREKFDPMNENFLNKSHKKFYKSKFRQLVAHDCSFIGYESGEYLLHYVNMYSVLHHHKVKLNGQVISLYDAYEVTDKVDGNSELKLRQGVTDLNGNAITKEFEDKVKNQILYCNQSTHGAMNQEDKGLIHQRIWGRAIMNFRQWMVEHYSRRFRKKHFDASLGMDREGYWRTMWEVLKEGYQDKREAETKAKAIAGFVGDFIKFMTRASANWASLNDMQKHNILRVRGEMLTYLSLLMLSMGLGDPDEKKGDWWTRLFIYETRRVLLDTEASFPLTPKIFKSATTILQSPIAGVNTLNSILYGVYGLTNGDLWTDLKSGRHKGENKYWTNVKRHVLPFFKNIEQIEHLDEDSGMFTVFNDTPTTH